MRHEIDGYTPCCGVVPSFFRFDARPVYGRLLTLSSHTTLTKTGKVRTDLLPSCCFARTFVCFFCTSRAKLGSRDLLGVLQEDEHASELQSDYRQIALAVADA